MKKFTLIAFFALLMSGCYVAPLYKIEGSTMSFEPYTQQGFIISTTTINQHFEPAGVVEVFCFAGEQPKQTAKPKEKNYADAIYNVMATTPKNFKPCTSAEMVDNLYGQALEIGANGLITLEFFTDNIDGRTAYCARALAVKIK